MDIPSYTVFALLGANDKYSTEYGKWRKKDKIGEKRRLNRRDCEKVNDFFTAPS